MSTTRHNSSRTVEPGPRWRTPKLLYLAAFAVAGVAVYLWGLAAAGRSEPTRLCRSTATVCQQVPPHDAGAADEFSGPMWPDPEIVERQITSQANLRRVAQRLDAAVKPGREPSDANRTVEEIARNLRVSCEWTSMPGEFGISIIYTDRHAEYAAGLVNALAGSYAQSCRAGWKQRTERAYAEAREALDRAQSESVRADARWAAFVEQHFGQTKPATKETAQSSGPLFLPEATLIDNPDWIELAGSLSELERRRTELLDDRTLEHPEVRKSAIDIAAIHERLAATPRKIPGQPSNASEPSGQTPLAQTEAPSAEPATISSLTRDEETSERFRELRVAAQAAAAAYERAVRVERQTWQQHQQEPQIELVLARPLDVSAPVPKRPGLGLMLVALAAGVAAALGTGMISTGAAIEPTIDTVAQAQAALSVPVVGTVKASEPDDRSVAVRRRQRWIRPAMILAGLGLIAGCAAVLGGAFGAW